MWRVSASCWCQFSPKESEVSAVFSLRDVWSLLRCSCECVSSLCIYVRRIGPQIPHKFISCSLLSPSVLFGGKKAFLAQNAGLCGSLFTALACDGGDTRSLPITDCHFDGDATGGESNSLSPSLWNTVYSLEGHKAASEHRDTHFHARTHIHTRS